MENTQNKQYTEEEAKAALTLLFLAGSLDESELETGTSPATTSPIETRSNGSPSPSDTTDDLIIDERELIEGEEEDEEEEDTLTNTLVGEEGAEEHQAEENEKDNEDLTDFLATCDMDSLIDRMTKVALSTVDFNDSAAGRVYEESNLRQRLERFIDEEEVQGTKYHASMKRVYASAADRSASKQMNRDKNNTASRLSRIRLRNAEQNLRIEAQKLDAENMARRMKKAVLLNYVQLLHNKLKLAPMDFNRPVKEILLEYGVNWEKVKGQ